MRLRPRPSQMKLRATGAVVQAFTQLLAGPEERHAFFTNGNRRPGSRIAALTRRPHFDRKGAKTAKFHAVTARQSRRNFVEHGRHNALHVPVIEIRIAFRQPRHQFGFDHLFAPGIAGIAAALRLNCQTWDPTSTREIPLSCSETSLLAKFPETEIVLAKGCGVYLFVSLV